MFLPATRYDQIKHEVLYLYEECEITAYPIDCFEIARKLYYIVVPYTALTDRQLRLAMEYSSEGFSVLRKQPNTGMFRYYIFYNDYNSIERQRWTIFHEIGHAYLGHHCSNCTLSEEECEREADFFADYCIAPPPLINIAMCADPCDVANTFIVSEFASIFIFVDFQNWLQSGPREYEDYEIKLLHQFGVAA